MSSEWMIGGQGGPRFRLLDDGHIEIEGQGTPQLPLPPAVNQWAPQIYAAQEKYNLPAHFIAAVVAIESMGNPNIVSKDGGMGLMQITSPSLKAGYTKEQLLDPGTNVMIGTKLLRSLWDREKGNIVRTLASYNAGSARCCASCLTHDLATKACLLPCPPNQWNLVAAPTCTKTDKATKTCLACKTLDYPGLVIAFANDALVHTFPIGHPAPALADAAPTQSALPILVAVAGGVGLLWGAQWLGQNRRRTGRWLP